MKTCPHCHQIIKHTDRWHVQICAKRPTDEQLNALRKKERLSILAIARRCDVSHRTARTWLSEAGLFTAGEERQSNSSAIQVLVGTALCSTPRGCNRCELLEICQKTVAQAQWALCEDMDEQQVIRRLGEGIDLHRIATEVKEHLSVRQADLVINLPP